MPGGKRKFAQPKINEVFKNKEVKIQCVQEMLLDLNQS